MRENVWFLVFRIPGILIWKFGISEKFLSQCDCWKDCFFLRWLKSFYECSFDSSFTVQLYVFLAQRQYFCGPLKTWYVQMTYWRTRKRVAGRRPPLCCQLLTKFTCTRRSTISLRRTSTHRTPLFARRRRSLSSSSPTTPGRLRRVLSLHRGCTVITINELGFSKL